MFIYIILIPFIIFSYFPMVFAKDQFDNSSSKYHDENISFFSIIIENTLKAKSDLSTHSSFQLEQNGLFNVEHLQYTNDLYINNKKESENIIKNSIEHAAASSISDLVQKTPVGKSLKKLSKKISKYTTAEFYKDQNNTTFFNHPWNKNIKNEQSTNYKYGAAASLDIFNDCSFNVIYFYYNTHFKTSLEPFNNKATVNISNSSLSSWLGINTSFESSIENSKSQAMFKLDFDF